MKIPRLLLNFFSFSWLNCKSTEKVKHKDIKRIGNSFQDFTDLIDKDCLILKIERYITDQYVIYFLCDTELYVIWFTTAINEEQKMLLKSKNFKFIFKENVVTIEPDIYTAERNRTALKVQYIDQMRGSYGVRDYVTF